MWNYTNFSQRVATPNNCTFSSPTRGVFAGGGPSDNIEFIRSSLDSYEIWVYIKLNKKLFFKNEKLYQFAEIEE